MISAAQFIWTVSSAFIILVIAGARIYTNMKNDLAKAKGDVNQLGRKYGRLVAMLAHSSWADTPEKQDQLARAIEPTWGN